MQQKLFVLSMDAMVREDIAYLEIKPNFKKLWKSGQRWTRYLPAILPVLILPTPH